MKQVLFSAALLLTPIAAYGADAPANASPPPPVAAAAPQQLTAEDAHNLLTLISRTPIQGSDAMAVARLMVVLNGIAEKK